MRVLRDACRLNVNVVVGSLQIVGDHKVRLQYSSLVAIVGFLSFTMPKWVITYVNKKQPDVLYFTYCLFSSRNSWLHRYCSLDHAKKAWPAQKWAWSPKFCTHNYISSPLTFNIFLHLRYNQQSIYSNICWASTCIAIVLTLYIGDTMKYLD